MLSQATVSSFEALSSVIEEEMFAKFLEAAHAEAAREGLQNTDASILLGGR